MHLLVKRLITTLQVLGATVALVGVGAHGILGDWTGVAKSVALLALITLTYLRDHVPNEE